MVGRGLFYGVAGVLLVAALPTAAQVEVKGQSSLEFNEREATIQYGQTLTVPIQITAELQCVPGFGAPDRPLEIWGTHGTSWLGPQGKHYYRTYLTTELLQFTAAGEGLYTVDAVVDLYVGSDAPVEHRTTKLVHYSVNSASGDGCGPAGWSMDASDPGELTLDVRPVNEGARDSSAVSVIGLLAVLGFAVLIGRRSG